MKSVSLSVCLSIQAYTSSKPDKRFKNRSGVSKFWNYGDSKGHLDLLQKIYLRLWKTDVQRAIVV